MKTSRDNRRQKKISLENWRQCLDGLTEENSPLFLQGLRDHPEWIHERNVWGSTPLMSAIFSHQIDIVEELIKAGADLNAKDLQGLTALMKAVFFKKTKVALMLINAGADVNLKNNEGWTALMLACKSQEDDVINELVKTADLNLQNQWGVTALMTAVMAGRLDFIQKMIAKSDVNLQDDDGQTALMHAVNMGYLNIVRFLWERGADPLIRRKNRDDLLSVAQSNGMSRNKQDLLDFLKSLESHQAMKDVISNESSANVTSPTIRVLKL